MVAVLTNPPVTIVSQFLRPSHHHFVCLNPAQQQYVSYNLAKLGGIKQIFPEKKDNVTIRVCSLLLIPTKFRKYLLINYIVQWMRCIKVDNQMQFGKCYFGGVKSVSYKSTGEGASYHPGASLNHSGEAQRAVVIWLVYSDQEVDL